MAKLSLFDNYYVQEVSAEAWEAVFSQHQAAVFPDEASIPFGPIFSDAEKKKVEALKGNLDQSLQVYWGAFQNYH